MTCNLQVALLVTLGKEIKVISAHLSYEIGKHEKWEPQDRK
jgi:hypothetical protein